MLLTLLLFAYSIRITLPMTLFLSATNKISAKKQIVESIFKVNIDKDECLDEMESKALAIFKEMLPPARAACLREGDPNKLSKHLKQKILQFLQPELKCAYWSGKKINEAIEIWVRAQPA